MCGIVAGVAERDVVPILMEGLRNLEYRGYDSAGIAIPEGGKFKRLRTGGKVGDLAKMLADNPLSSDSGIAHTRWATHGAPNEINAHPHVAGGRISVVHNGIIENYQSLREELIGQGHDFESETDTEVIGHLVLRHVNEGHDLLESTRLAVSRLEGAYAIAVADSENPALVCGARLGSPLVVGVGFGENFVASDIHALLPVTNRFVRLEDGDIVAVERTSWRIIDGEGNEQQRDVLESEHSPESVQRGQYRHYMLKEIFEQPAVLADTLEGRLINGEVAPGIFGQQSAEIFKQARAVHIVACGTSFHAGLIARYWIEALTGLPCNVEVASEYRYRKPVVLPETLFVTISQSGETADTLSALRLAKKREYLATLAICNVPESSLVRESDLVFMTRAGPEIGVASTKAFTTQLVALYLLTLEIGAQHGMDAKLCEKLIEELKHLPAAVTDALKLAPRVEELAERFVNHHHALFLGRGAHYPVAMEGALKLKEISYIHAEAYPAGELKHGPLALVDEDMPVIAVAPNDDLREKLKSNIQEVRARGGELFVFADGHARQGLEDGNGHMVEVDGGGELAAPIVFTIPLQLLAYYVAVLKGTDVDQPRNLAKSVTVE